MSFEVLEHTADIGFRAWGDSWRQLVENASLALVSIYLDNSAAEPRESIAIAVSGEDRESLLVNWLNEIVYLVDGLSIAVRSVLVDEIGESHLTGRALGEPRSERHPTRLIVKGVTWHQLKVERGNQGWCCEVYLDV
jgi:SHS2 domain-containing protein